MRERDRGRMGRQGEGEDRGEQGKSSCVGVFVFGVILR